MTKNYIKEAEKNVVNNARYCQDVIKVVEALRRFTYRFMDNRTDTARYNRAMSAFSEFRDAVYDQMNENIAKSFLFVGIGGEDALKFSREKFKEHFGEERYVVMHFLEEGGNLPMSWKKDVEEEFREQAKQKINQFNNE